MTIDEKSFAERLCGLCTKEKLFQEVVLKIEKRYGFYHC